MCTLRLGRTNRLTCHRYYQSALIFENLDLIFLSDQGDLVGEDLVIKPGVRFLNGAKMENTLWVLE